MTRRRPVNAALLSGAALSAVLLTGCGTGLEAQTYQARTPFDFTDGSVNGGDLSVRGVYLAAEGADGSLATGGTAVVAATVVNSGRDADTLTGATATVADDARLAVAGETVTEVAVGALGTTPSDFTIVLDGLNRDLRIGEYVDVTFTFAKAGRTTLSVPVRAGDNGLTEREAAQNPYGEHGAEGGEEGAEGEEHPEGEKAEGGEHPEGEKAEGESHTGG